MEMSMAETEQRRPTSVVGPNGTILTMETLPPPDTRRWVARRKAEVVTAVRAGLMTLKEAIARQGYDPAQVLAEIGTTNAELDRLGITLDTDPGKATRTGAAKPGPQGHTVDTDSAIDSE